MPWYVYTGDYYSITERDYVGHYEEDSGLLLNYGVCYKTDLTSPPSARMEAPFVAEESGLQ